MAPDPERGAGKALILMSNDSLCYSHPQNLLVLSVTWLPINFCPAPKSRHDDADEFFLKSGLQRQPAKPFGLAFITGGASSFFFPVELPDVNSFLRAPQRASGASRGKHVAALAPHTVASSHGTPVRTAREELACLSAARSGAWWLISYMLLLGLSTRALPSKLLVFQILLACDLLPIKLIGWIQPSCKYKLAFSCKT